MISQLCDQDLIASFFVNDPMLGSDPSRPKTLERMLERFGLANASVWISYNLFDQQIDSRNHLRIGLLPIKIILPGLGSKNEIHAPSLILRLSPLPRFKVSTAASNRLAFAGERSR